MNILYYCTEADSDFNKINRIIDVMVPVKKFATTSSLKIMENHLLSSLSVDFLIILQVSDAAELQNIIELKELLLDYRIIMILPDDNPDTTVLAHTLHPRLITYKDGDFLDVTAVLSRMNVKADNF